MALSDAPETGAHENSTLLLPGVRTLKFAVTLLFPLIVIFAGFPDPLRSPLQEPNVYPVFGVRRHRDHCARTVDSSGRIERDRAIGRARRQRVVGLSLFPVPL